jgi:CshA-type fibril repeat protein
LSPSATLSRCLRSGGKLALAALVAAMVQLPLTANAAPLTPSQADPPPQDETISLGQDFWVAFPSNLEGSGAISLYLSGTEEGTGTVAVPGQDWSQPFTITPGEVANVALPSAFQVTATDAVVNLGIHITSTTDIAVYGVNYQDTTSGAYLGLPVESLGQRYRVLAYESLRGFLPSQLTVVATVDDTTLTITPKIGSSAHLAGVPFDVTINAGQVYQYASETDVTGTVVQSTAPVSVFGGADCTNVPASAGACDHLVQQLPPTSAWGTDFLSVRFANRIKGDTYRVLANEDDTEISVNGAVVATIDSGEFWESVLPEGAVDVGAEGIAIHTSKPSLVAQYGNGSQYDDSTGDPLMMLIPPAGQYLDAYTFAAPNLSGYASYMTLVVPTADVGNVILDGEAIPAENFSVIGASNYSGAQMTITSATHNLTGPHPFGVQVYEWGSYDGFGFPGGMAMKQIYVDPQDPLNALNLTSEDTAPAAQQVTVTIPDGGSVSLLDGADLVNTVTLTDIGTYVLNPETGVITFTPVAGYSGTPDPVTYQIVAGEESATGTYTPTVNAPDGPTTSFLTSTGAGTTPQSVTVTLAEGNTVALVNGVDLVNEIVAEGFGTFVLNPETGEIVFVAEAGYTGSDLGINYTVTDIYGQTSTGIYKPTVTVPDGPVATPKESSGNTGDAQTITVTVPPGGSVMLLDSEDNPTTEVVVEGEGTYTVNPETGVITFVPEDGFEGTAAGVKYRVTDAYDQSADASYTPTVEPGTVHGPKPKMRLNATELGRLGGHHSDRIPTHCILTHGKAAVCKVALVTRVNGDRTVIGHGQKKADVARRNIWVTVHLNKLGQALAARPGGVTAVAEGQSRVAKTQQWLRDSDKTRVVHVITHVARPLYFDPSSAAVSARDRAFLKSLRGKLDGVKKVVCAGYTDSSGNGKANKALGLERARNTCKLLAGSTHVATKLVSYGEARPTAPNDTAAGRALNRRAEITLLY